MWVVQPGEEVLGVKGILLPRIDERKPSLGISKQFEGDDMIVQISKLAPWIQSPNLSLTCCARTAEMTCSQIFQHLHHLGGKEFKRECSSHKIMSIILSVGSPSGVLRSHHVIMK